MASVSWGEIAPAAAARAIAGSFASATEIALHAAIATAINLALTTGLFTTTVAASAYTASMVQNQMVLLEGLGYTVSYSGTTITVSW